MLFDIFRFKDLSILRKVSVDYKKYLFLYIYWKTLQNKYVLQVD